MADFPRRSQLIDLRRAAASDDRESAIALALQQLRETVDAGDTVEITWPLDRDSAIATSLLGAPLALVVASIVHGSDGAVVIHTRTALPADFLTSPPTERISFVFHLNCEEAAMRWERADVEPSKRLAAAARLTAAGWQVWPCVGPVRCFSGWRDEYADLVNRAAAAGIKRLLVSFPGEDAMELKVSPDTDGLDAVATDEGYKFTVSGKHRREIYSFLKQCMQQG